MNKPKRRRSTQRERIWQLVAAGNRHPTAVQIHALLRREFPSLGLGNVYRNLAILVEEGRLVRKTLRDGVEHYDAVTSDHYHFVCERCGAVSDFPMPYHRSLTVEARRRSRHRIRGHTVQFYGMCSRCRSVQERTDKPTTKNRRSQ